ncbi:hypothetical protein EXN66_Car000150 [Channa argus]|uniref:Uncharacterized protein n=1 Tax=Channa argus TaxID=215402 RepID=A0A6G1QXN5_CHAAH|nr:hypothetical protein EXN66_Car000150 [Channa argus]
MFPVRNDLQNDESGVNVCSLPHKLLPSVISSLEKMLVCAAVILGQRRGKTVSVMVKSSFCFI